MNHAQAIAFVASYVEHRNATFDLAIEVLTEAALRARTDARALWAVRVLDAYAEHHETTPRVPVRQWGGTFVVSFAVAIDGIWEHREAEGATRNAARLAAAEAVFPELPEAVRAELGDRP